MDITLEELVAEMIEEDKKKALKFSERALCVAKANKSKPKESTYNLLVKMIGNFITPTVPSHSVNYNKIHYVSLTKNEKMNLVQYQKSGIGSINNNFSLRKYEVQDFCVKINV